MDWHNLLTTLFGAGTATALVSAVSIKWVKDRGTKYLDESVVGAIEAHHSRELEKFKRILAGDLERQKGDITTEVELRKFELPVYNSLWTALAKVKLSGDALWREVTFDNLGDFRDRLREAELLVHASGALLPYEEYTQLVALIEKFQSFQVGKAELLRTYQYEPGLQQFSQTISEMIAQNRKNWNSYNELFVALQAVTRKHIYGPLAQHQQSQDLGAAQAVE
jgi:hypothetical protein